MRKIEYKKYKKFRYKVSIGRKFIYSLILGNFISKKFVLFVLDRNGGNFMNHRSRLDFNVSTWVSLEVKQKLYEIAELENTTVSNITRRFLEEAVSAYKEVTNNGN
jgi:hypothetical protein